jgi:cytochrome b561
MSPRPDRFSVAQRTVHWLMAAMILAMLFIGVAMLASVRPYTATLVAIHRPLGIAILVLVLLRLGLRWWSGAPALPADLPWWQAAAARASHVALYALMLAMPLLGWAMLSAGGYPIVLVGPLHLPPIAPHDDRLHALLWTAHRCLAFAFFATILLHLAAALFHALVRRDGVFTAMAPWRARRSAG